MRSFVRRSPWVVTASVLLIILAIGVTLMSIGIARSPAPKEAFWTDVAKAGLQIAVITFLGAVVTATFKYVDDRRRRDEQRLQVFRDTIAAYNRVKEVRRNLRALGLIAPTKPLSAEQARGLREQMMALNEAQLSFEAVKRELQESHMFRRSKEMGVHLRTAEDYLSKSALGPWQEHGGEIWEGAGVETLRPLQLASFAGRQRDGYTDFREKVSTRLDDLTSLLHQELFGEKLEATEARSEPR